jgi:hypothetical protein
MSEEAVVVFSYDHATGTSSRRHNSRKSVRTGNANSTSASSADRITGGSEVLSGVTTSSDRTSHNPSCMGHSPYGSNSSHGDSGGGFGAV